jgi:hypothetical protein
MSDTTRIRACFHIGSVSPPDVTISTPDGDSIENAHLGGVWVAGRLYGGIIHDTPIGRSAMVERLRECKTLEDLRDIASGGLGPFYVILRTQTHVHIASSAASPGVYYRLGPQPQFSDNELTLFSGADPPALNTEETLRFVVDNLNRSPHQGLFDGVQRAPGATFLSFDLQSGTAAVECLVRNGAEACGSTFGRLVDSCAKVLIDDFRDRDRFPVVYWSGGIDGLVWLIALVKAGGNVTVIHGCDPRSSSMFAALCREVTERLPRGASVRTIVADRSDDNEGDAESTMLGGLIKSNYLRLDYRLKIADLALARSFPNADKAVVITGFGVDGLYSYKKGGELLSSTNGGRLSFYHASVMHYAKYLGAVLGIRQAFVNAFLPGRDAKARSSYKLFCKCTADTTFLRSKSAAPDVKTLFRSHLSQRFRFITRLASGFEGCFFHSRKQPLYKSLKLAGYFNNDSVHAARFRDQGRYGDCVFEVPYLFTPFLQFFSNRPLAFADLLTPKSLLHDYVKSSLGIRYGDLLRKARAASGPAEVTPQSQPATAPPEGVGDRQGLYVAKLRRVYTRHRHYWGEFQSVAPVLGSFLRRIDDELMRRGHGTPRGRHLENFVHLTAWLNIHSGGASVQEDPR